MSENAPSDDQDEVLPPESLYEGCTVTCWDCTPEEAEAARIVESQVLALTKHLSRFLDLSHLEAIVIGKDYPAAVASVERNLGGERTGPTVNEYGIGQAMAITVNRNDELWSVVVLAAPLAILLVNDHNEGRRFALFTLVHELAHVDDQRLLRAFPGGWRAAHTDHDLKEALLGMCEPCRSEYVAARRAARIWPEQGEGFFNLAEAALGDLESQVAAAVQAHGRDMPVFWPIIRARIGFVFQARGYALGHADGLEDGEVDFTIKAEFESRLEALRRLPNGWLVDEARTAAQRLHHIEAYTGMEVHDELMAIVDKLLKRLGIYTREVGRDIRIDIFR